MLKKLLKITMVSKKKAIFSSDIGQNRKNSNDNIDPWPTLSLKNVF
jgi:hypothetical protein